MNQNNLFAYMASVVSQLKEERRMGTAHVYQSTLRRVMEFEGEETLDFKDLTPAWLKSFQDHLLDSRLQWNTVSTYMKVLRATYNRAVDEGCASYVPRLFRHVHTGVSAERKRSLEASDMGGLMNDKGEELSAGMERTLAILQLMFVLRGIPFVDLVYLRKSDIQGNILRYRRRKTGRRLTVILTPEALKLIDTLSDKREESPYLLPFLTSPEGSEEAYREYQRALRSFNRQLAALGERFGGTTPISTYTIRHTWATMAYYCEIHPGIISEAMGHSSIAVTETYLKPFRDDRIDEANREVISYVKKRARKSSGR